MHCSLLPNSRPFIVITIRIAPDLYSVVSFCSDSCFAVVVVLNSIISVYCLLPPAPCSANTFFCHSNMCINNSLVCNGVQNCVYPWDENHCKGNHFLSHLTTIYIYIIHHFQLICFSYSGPFFLYLLPPPEKRSKGLFHQITKTHGTVIGVSSGIVLVLLIISILVQMKQPRKKVTHPLCLTFFFFDGKSEPVEKLHIVSYKVTVGWLWRQRRREKIHFRFYTMTFNIGVKTVLYQNVSFTVWVSRSSFWFIYLFHLYLLHFVLSPSIPRNYYYHTTIFLLFCKG